MNVDAEYDPERDGRLLKAGEVCRLLGVSRSHLPNLRKVKTLRGYQIAPGSDWRYPSGQRVIREALAALQGNRR